MRAQEPDVAEHVLAVLRPDHHPVPPGRVAGGAPWQVGDARELVAPLRREHVDQPDVLGGRLQQRGRGGEEVDVRIGRDPAAGPQVANVRPARIAADQASKVSGSPGSRRA